MHTEMQLAITGCRLTVWRFAWDEEIKQVRLLSSRLRLSETDYHCRSHKPEITGPTPVTAIGSTGGCRYGQYVGCTAIDSTIVG